MRKDENCEFNPFRRLPITLHVILSMERRSSTDLAKFFLEPISRFSTSLIRAIEARGLFRGEGHGAVEGPLRSMGHATDRLAGSITFAPDSGFTMQCM